MLEITAIKCHYNVFKKEIEERTEKKSPLKIFAMK